MRDVGHYRMAPALVVRQAGLAVVLVALLVLVVGAVAALAGWPPVVVAAVALVGLVAALGLAAWLRWGAAVVRLDDDGYRIRFLRDAGPRSGAWAEVLRAVTTSPGGVPCLVLHRHDGRETVVPLRLLGADGDRFTADVVARLEAAAASDSSRPAGA